MTHTPFGRLPEMSSFEEYNQWYKNQCKIARKKSNRFKVSAFRILFFVGLLPTGISAFFLYYNYQTLLHNGNPAIDSFLLTTTISFTVGLLLFIFFKTKDRLQSFDIQVREGILKPIAAEKIPQVHSLVEKLRERMKLGNKQIRYWMSKGQTYLPSIEETESTIDLILPVNFFTLTLKEPLSAEALLAHEFGHILQKDTKLWLLVDSFGHYVQRILVPLALLFFVIKLITMGPMILETNRLSDPLLLQYLINLGVLVFFMQRVRAARRSSEHLADFASVMFTNTQEIATALKKYAADKRQVSFLRVHPTRDQRLVFIQSLPQVNG